MKKFILITLLFTAAGVYKADAQFGLSIRIGSRQPDWGPAGYDNAQYYYLPDYDAYYDVPDQQFVYFDEGRWNFAAALPGEYGNVDLYNTYKVVINDRDPWLRNGYYHDNYAQFRGRYQPVIRERYNDRRSAYSNGYFANRFDNRVPEGSFNRDGGYRNHDEDRQSWRGDDHGSWRGDNGRQERSGDEQRKDNGGRGRDDHHNNSFGRDGHDRR